MIQPAEQDVIYHAIAHHTRREILDLLGEGPKPVMAIASLFSVSQPAISQQLRVLLEAGLVSAESRGRERFYKLNRERLRMVQEWVSRAIADPTGNVWIFRSRKKGN